MKENNPLGYTAKFFLIAVLSAFLIFALGYVFTRHINNSKSNTSLSVFNENDKIRFVIDAGHGGEDAGAIADDGTLEKDLNLDISLLLSAILELNGNEVVLTRDDDKLLYDYYNDLDDYTGKKKVYDLKNRLKIAEEKENSLYVGIHMNKFSQSKYSGLQVYYSKNDDLSQDIASCISDTVKSNLQPDNNRKIKAGNSSIYILNGASVPAVLVECGFMSNESELENLKSADYQKSLALCLFTSLINFSN